MSERLNAIITGGTGSIGGAIVMKLAMTGQYHITVACRDQAKGESLMEKINTKTGKEVVDYLIVDTSSHESIRKLGSTINKPIHLLMNVAAATPRERTETPEGIEVQFATNVLGYFWMIQEIAPHMPQGSRIVNVASCWIGGLNLNDPQFKARPYDNDQAYQAAKEADIMLTAAFAQRLLESGITVNCCHPGDVDSKLSRDLGFHGTESPEQGAETPFFVATSSELAQKTGKYFQNKKEKRCPTLNERESIERLFRMCSEFN